VCLLCPEEVIRNDVLIKKLETLLTVMGTHDDKVRGVLQSAQRLCSEQHFVSDKSSDKAVEDRKVFVLGMFADKDGDAAKAFLEVAGAQDNPKFGITSDAGVKAEYGIEGDAVIVFKTSTTRGGTRPRT